MTENEFIQNIQDEITVSGLLPIVLGAKEIQRIINQSRMYFYETYRFATEKQSYIIEKKHFDTPHFKKNRILILPDCVSSVIRVQEIRGISRFGTPDRDFSENRLLASEIYLGSVSGDDLVMRTAQMQYFDLTKAFMLDQVGYSYNHNTRKLNIEGRDPKYDLFVDTYSKVNLEFLFNDWYFLRFCTAKAKISYARALGTYKFPLPGGVELDYDSIRSEGESELDQIEEKIKNLDPPSFMLVFH